MSAGARIRSSTDTGQCDTETRPVIDVVEGIQQLALALNELAGERRDLHPDRIKNSSSQALATGRRAIELAYECANAILAAPDRGREMFEQYPELVDDIGGGFAAAKSDSSANTRAALAIGVFIAAGGRAQEADIGASPNEIGRVLCGFDGVGRALGYLEGMNEHPSQPLQHSNAETVAHCIDAAARAELLQPRIELLLGFN